MQTTFYGKKFSPNGVALPPYQGGGLVAWQDPQDFIHIRWQPSTCIIAVQAVIADKFVVNDGPTSTNQVACAQSSDPMWLRLTKQGDVYTGYYSTDGKTWTIIDKAYTESTLQPTYVGVMSSEGGMTATPNPEGFRDFTVGTGAMSAGSTTGATSSSAPASSTASSSTATKASSSSAGSTAKMPKTGSGPLPVLLGLLAVGAGAVLVRKSRTV